MNKKIGRPLKKINWNDVEKLCALHCTGEEIASFLGINYDTLVTAIRREYDMSFSDYFKTHSATGKISLRRKQFEVANDGNVTMLIWLGKQYLGQSEKVSQEVEITENHLKDLTDEELMELAKQNGLV